MKPVACDPWALNTVWESVRGQILLWDYYKQTFPYEDNYKFIHGRGLYPGGCFIKLFVSYAWLYERLVYEVLRAR